MQDVASIVAYSDSLKAITRNLTMSAILNTTCKTAGINFDVDPSGEFPTQ